MEGWPGGQWWEGGARLGKVGTGVAGSFIAGHDCPLLQKQGGQDDGYWILPSNLVMESLRFGFWVLPG